MSSIGVGYDSENKIYELDEIAKDHLEYGDWIQFVNKNKKAPIKLDLQDLGTAAKLCILPTIHGGMDPPPEPVVFDPKIHAKPPVDEIPLEYRCQLHAGNDLNKLLLIQGENKWLSERKSVISIFGSKRSGKTTLLKLLFGVNGQQNPIDMCRLATAWYPRKKTLQRKAKIREWIPLKNQAIAKLYEQEPLDNVGNDQSTNANGTGTVAVTQNGGRKSQSPESQSRKNTVTVVGGNTTTADGNTTQSQSQQSSSSNQTTLQIPIPSESTPQSPTSRRNSQAGSTVQSQEEKEQALHEANLTANYYGLSAAEKEKEKRLEAERPGFRKQIKTCYFFHRDDFNRFKACDADRKSDGRYPDSEPTQGINLWHWHGPSCEEPSLILDTEGLRFGMGRVHGKLSGSAKSRKKHNKEFMRKKMAGLPIHSAASQEVEQKEMSNQGVSLQQELYNRWVECGKQIEFTDEDIKQVEEDMLTDQVKKNEEKMMSMGSTGQLNDTGNTQQSNDDHDDDNTNHMMDEASDSKNKKKNSKSKSGTKGGKGQGSDTDQDSKNNSDDAHLSESSVENWESIPNYSAHVSQKRIIDAGYKTFLPPLLYGMSDICIMVLSPEDDLKTYLEQWTKSVLQKVRNSLRPVLIIIVNHKKRKHLHPDDDDLRYKFYVPPLHKQKTHQAKAEEEKKADHDKNITDKDDAITQKSKRLKKQREKEAFENRGQVHEDMLKSFMKAAKQTDRTFEGAPRFTQGVGAGLTSDGEMMSGGESPNLMGAQASSFLSSSKQFGVVSGKLNKSQALGGGKSPSSRVSTATQFNPNEVIDDINFNSQSSREPSQVTHGRISMASAFRSGGGGGKKKSAKFRASMKDLASSIKDSGSYYDGKVKKPQKVFDVTKMNREKIRKVKRGSMPLTLGKGQFYFDNESDDEEAMELINIKSKVMSQMRNQKSVYGSIAAQNQRMRQSTPGWVQSNQLQGQQQNQNQDQDQQQLQGPGLQGSDQDQTEFSDQRASTGDRASGSDRNSREVTPLVIGRQSVHDQFEQEMQNLTQEEAEEVEQQILQEQINRMSMKIRQSQMILNQLSEEDRSGSGVQSGSGEENQQSQTDNENENTSQDRDGPDANGNDEEEEENDEDENVSSESEQVESSGHSISTASEKSSSESEEHESPGDKSENDGEDQDLDNDQKEVQQDKNGDQLQNGVSLTQLPNDSDPVLDGRESRDTESNGGSLRPSQGAADASETEKNVNGTNDKSSNNEQSQQRKTARFDTTEDLTNSSTLQIPLPQNTSDSTRSNRNTITSNDASRKTLNSLKESFLSLTSQIDQKQKQKQAMQADLKKTFGTSSTRAENILAAFNSKSKFKNKVGEAAKLFGKSARKVKALAGLQHEAHKLDYHPFDDLQDHCIEDHIIGGHPRDVGSGGLDLDQFRIYFSSIKVYHLDDYPRRTLNGSRRYIRKMQAIRKSILEGINLKNELKTGAKGRKTVSADVEYAITVPVWHGISNFHMLYLLKVMISWINLKFPLYMALAANYVSAHVPTNTSELRLVTFQAMRAFLADLLSPVDPGNRGVKVQDSLDLRWTAAISALARYVVKMGDNLLVRDFVSLKSSLLQWLPCSAVAINPKTGEQCTCSQPRAFHGPVHRCDRTGTCWEGEYLTPKWTFDPAEKVSELIAIYEAKLRQPWKLSKTEAQLPKHERQDVADSKKDEGFFEITASNGGFDLFQERVSDQFGPPFCALCFKTQLPEEYDLLEQNRARSYGERVKIALKQKNRIVKQKFKDELERSRLEAQRIEEEQAQREYDEQMKQLYSTKKNLKNNNNNDVLNSSLNSNTGIGGSDANSVQGGSNTPHNMDHVDYQSDIQSMGSKSTASGSKHSSSKNRLNNSKQKTLGTTVGGRGPKNNSKLPPLDGAGSSRHSSMDKNNTNRNRTKSNDTNRTSSNQQNRMYDGMYCYPCTDSQKDDRSDQQDLNSFYSDSGSQYGSDDSESDIEYDNYGNRMKKGLYFPDISDLFQQKRTGKSANPGNRISQQLATVERRRLSMTNPLKHATSKEMADPSLLPKTITLAEDPPIHQPNSNVSDEIGYQNSWKPKYSSGITQVHNARARKGVIMDARTTTYNKNEYMKSGLKDPLMRFETMAQDARKRKELEEQNLGYDEEEYELSLESAIAEGVDAEAIARSQYVRMQQAGFTADQFNWLEQTFRNTSSRYIRFCESCYDGYRRHYRQRGVPDKSKYEENWHVPIRKVELFQPQPLRNCRGHYVRDNKTGRFKLEVSINPIKNIPNIRENNYPERRYNFEYMNTLKHPLPGGGFDNWQVTFQPGLSDTLLKISENRDLCGLCGKKGVNFAMVKPCSHRFCLGCILDFRDWCHENSDVLRRHKHPLPSSTFWGLLCDVKETYPKRWCPVCKLHIKTVICLHSLNEWFNAEATKFDKSGNRIRNTTTAIVPSGKKGMFQSAVSRVKTVNNLAGGGGTTTGTGAAAAGTAAITDNNDTQATGTGVVYSTTIKKKPKILSQEEKDAMAQEASKKQMTENALIAKKKAEEQKNLILGTGKFRIRASQVEEFIELEKEDRGLDDETLLKGSTQEEASKLDEDEDHSITLPQSLEDWANDQGFTPFPAKPPQSAQAKDKIYYPKFQNPVNLVQWAVNQTQGQGEYLDQALKKGELKNVPMS